MTERELLDVFEPIKSDFGHLDVDQFTEKYLSDINRFELWDFFAETSIAQYWNDFSKNKGIAVRKNLPQSTRKAALRNFNNSLDQIILLLRTGQAVTKKHIDDKILATITDDKIKKICFEINATPIESTIALTGLIGIALQWTLYYKAQKSGSTTQEKDAEFSKVLSEVLDKKYYTDYALNRLLGDYRTNINKKSYDMVRHSATFIPDQTTINSDLVILEHVLKFTF